MRNRKFKDLTGIRFGRLVVTGIAERLSTKNMRWSCLCDCGKTTIAQSGALKSGRQISCGCYRLDCITKHGHAYGHNGSKTYIAWQQMKSRCNNTKHKWFGDYGGRGIKVCDRWSIFENFLADMGSAPVGTEIDRIDNDGDYTPENCRWATRRQQINNRRTTVMIEYQGIKKSRSEWCEEFGINPSTFANRLKRGWTVQNALEQPIKLKI